METTPPKSPSLEAWTEQIVTTLHSHSNGARDLLAAHQARLEEAEIAVAQELDRLEQELKGQRDVARDFLAAQQARLEQAQTAVEQELQRIEDELKTQRGQADGLRAARDVLAGRLNNTESLMAESEPRPATPSDLDDLYAGRAGLVPRRRLTPHQTPRSRQRSTGR
jgi:chromosome segregation ATPase